MTEQDRGNVEQNGTDGRGEEIIAPEVNIVAIPDESISCRTIVVRENTRHCVC